MKGPRYWPKFWVTAGYLGFAPGAPGTCGTLGGFLLALLVNRYTDLPQIRAYALCSLLALFCGVTLLYGDWAEREFGRKDPPQAVSDEVAGFLLSVLMLPPLREGWEEAKLGAAFALFRLFDIWKPGPIRRLQALPGGAGILLDNLAAGLLANACLQVVLRYPLRGLLLYTGL